MLRNFSACSASSAFKRRVFSQALKGCATLTERRSDGARGAGGRQGSPDSSQVRDERGPGGVADGFENRALHGLPSRQRSSETAAPCSRDGDDSLAPILAYVDRHQAIPPEGNEGARDRAGIDADVSGERIHGHRSVLLQAHQQIELMARQAGRFQRLVEHGDDCARGTRDMPQDAGARLESAGLKAPQRLAFGSYGLLRAR
jgi:hypothetical protein